MEAAGRAHGPGEPLRRSATDQQARVVLAPELEMPVEFNVALDEIEPSTTVGPFLQAAC